jgi:hypothetical protein
MDKCHIKMSRFLKKEFLDEQNQTKNVIKVVVTRIIQFNGVLKFVPSEFEIKYRI